MKETFEEYVDRVSRARHILLTVIEKADYFMGVSVGYKNVLLLLDSENKAPFTKAAVEELSGVARRASLAVKTKALIVQDKILTYRENEL